MQTSRSNLHHWQKVARLVAAMAAGSLVACSGTTGGGGGGFYDAGTCDAKADAKCSSTIGTGDAAGSTDGQTTSDGVLTDTANADDATLGDDTGTGGDDAFDPDAPDFGGFFDDDVQDPTDTGSGPLNSDCNERAKIVYVVTEENKLLSFNPDTLAFKLVGTLNCAVSNGSPFSMSVDRNANAWVLYQVSGAFSTKGGGIYKVSTLDATCQSTSYVANGQGFELFGMGFSANSFGSKDETLFIAGAAAGTFQSVKNKLGTITFPGMAVTPVSTLDITGGADLTGNGKGELFGFFPESSPPSVRQIDKATGTTSGQVWKLPTNIFQNTQAWAFAQWGGNFYLFFKTIMDTNSSVYKLDPGTGVSSCAPTGAVTP